MAGNGKNPKIQPVESRQDKRNTYDKQMRRYERAMRGEFYLEAVLIMYACLEDRLLYMLYHLGVLTDERKFAAGQGRSARVQAYRAIAKRYNGEKAMLSVFGIKKKMQLVSAIMQMLLEEGPYPEESRMEALLRAKLADRERISGVLGLLKEIEDWCDYRNEVIHSLMHKNVESLNEELAAQAEKGKKLFRSLDGYVRWIKGKKIRGALHLTE